MSLFVDADVYGDRGGGNGHGRSHVAAAARQGIDDGDEETYSKRVADMVLAGWTLLDECCPVFGAVPLVMDARGRKYSVAQEAYVRHVDAPPALASGSVASATPLPRRRNGGNDDRCEQWQPHGPVEKQQQQQGLSTVLTASSTTTQLAASRPLPGDVVDSRRYTYRGAAGVHTRTAAGGGHHNGGTRSGSKLLRPSASVSAWSSEASGGDGGGGGEPPVLLLPPGPPPGTVLDAGAVLRATRQTLLAKIQAAEQGLKEDIGGGGWSEPAGPGSGGGGGGSRSDRVSDAAITRMERLAALLRDCTQALVAVQQLSGED